MPPVARWLTGLATSLVGNQIYLVALAWVAVQTTTPANVGWILVAGAVPQALMLLLGGVFVDRIGPKRIIITSDLLRTLVMAVFALVVMGEQISPLLLGVLSVIFGVVDGFFLPAVSTAPRYLGNRAAIVRITAARTVVARGAEFVGSPIASWILIAASPAAAFGVNVVLFAGSVVALAATPMRELVEEEVVPEEVAAEEVAAPADDPSDADQETGSVWADIAAGARLIREHKTLGSLLIVVTVMELGFSGPMTAGVPLLADETRWGVKAVGWMFGGFGAGAALAAALLTWRKVRRTGLAVVLGLTAMGLGVVLLGGLPLLRLPASTAVVIAGLLAAAAGLGSGFFGTLVTSAVLTLAPAGQMGRVMGALSFSSLAAVPITFALTGLVTGWTNAKLPFLLGGLLVLAAAAIAAANGEVRHLRMTPATLPADSESDCTR